MKASAVKAKRNRQISMEEFEAALDLVVYNRTGDTDRIRKYHEAVNKLRALYRAERERADNLTQAIADDKRWLVTFQALAAAREGLREIVTVFEEPCLAEAIAGRANVMHAIAEKALAASEVKDGE